MTSSNSQEHNWVTPYCIPNTCGKLYTTLKACPTAKSSESSGSQLVGHDSFGGGTSDIHTT